MVPDMVIKGKGKIDEETNVSRESRENASRAREAHKKTELNHSRYVTKGGMLNFEYVHKCIILHFFHRLPHI